MTKFRFWAAVAAMALSLSLAHADDQDYAKTLQNLNKGGLVGYVGVNAVDTLVACPVDAAELAVLAVTDTLPVFALFGTGIAGISHELSSGDNYFDTLGNIHAHRSGRYSYDDDFYEVTTIVGSALPLAFAAVVDVGANIGNAARYLAERHHDQPLRPDFHRARGVLNASYLNVSAEFELSFRDRDSHCRASLHNLNLIGHEAGARAKTDSAARDAKQIIGSNAPTQPAPAATGEGVRPGL